MRKSGKNFLALYDPSIFQITHDFALCIQQCSEAKQRKKRNDVIHHIEIMLILST